MRIAELAVLAFIVAGLFVACTEILVVQINECDFYVSDETPLVLTADTIRWCQSVGLAPIHITIVEFP